MFFDEYARFFETSRISPFQGRLNLRYEAIFAANRDVFQGARVLDLASHDGRWSFAALQTGAAHVTGIEARQELVDNARETFTHYGAAPDSYRFFCGDVFDVLYREKPDVDVVLCLGYLYHTYRHTEFFHLLRDLDPQYVIIDSHVVPHVKQPFVKLRFDYPEKQGDAILDPYAYGERTLVGLPSVPAIRLMLRAYDFGVEQIYDWQRLLAENPDVGKVGDYRDGWRVTLRSRSGVSTDGAGEEPADETAGTDVPDSGSPRETAATAAAKNGGTWRDKVNQTLAKTTGYELRRAPRSRRS